MSEEEVVAEEPQDDPEGAAAESAAEEPAVEAVAAEAEPEAAAEAENPAEPEPEPEPVEEERHRLSRPRVIDIESLLRPISAEAPSGEYLRYHGIYDEISESRRADEILEQGAWQTELKVADFRKVIQLAVPVIQKETKDLQIAAWLVEALVAEHGFEGFRDGVKLLSSLLLKFWDTLYPEIEEGDEEGRANALAWIDREAGVLIKNAPITVDGWGYSGFLDSKKFDIPVNFDGLTEDEKKRFAELKEQAERENRATAAKWQVAVAKTDRAFCEETRVALLECFEEYEKLNAAIEAKFDRNQAPSLPEMRRSLQDIKAQQETLLEMKRAEEPDPADEMEEEGDGESGGASKSRGVGGGPINSRNEALRRLAEIAAYFRSTEPHSPVSYLVNRAIQWGNMPLDSWLQDVIKDQNILNQLKETLGFNTAAAPTDAAPQPNQPGAPPPEPPPQQ